MSARTLFPAFLSMFLVVMPLWLRKDGSHLRGPTSA